MNNIIFDETLNIACLIALNFLVLLNLRSSVFKRNKIHTGYFVFLTFITAFSIYYRPLDGDFWYSLQEFTSREIIYREHMEPIYIWLKEILNSDYLIWRFIVWGFAGIFVVMIYKRLDIPPALATVSFLVFALLDSFYYMRNALGFSILYFAIAYFVKNTGSNARMRFFILLTISFLSYFFHRSMPLYIFLSYLALVLEFNKKTFIYILLCFPILYVSINVLASDVLTASIWQDDGGTAYLSAENESFTNWKGMIILFIKYLPYIYIVYCFIRYDIKASDSEVYARRCFFLIFFFLVYLSFLFMGQGSKHLQLRFWNTAMYPFAIFIALFFKRYAPHKRCTIFAFLVGFSILLPFILSIAA